MNPIEQLISLFVPFSCLGCGQEGELICRNCQSKINFVSENVKIQSIHEIFCRTPYQGLSKSLLHNYKFERAKTAHRTISSLMLQVLPDLPENSWVVPVVTASRRVRQRGYDQSVLLAKDIAKARNLQFKSILRRDSNIRQMGSNRQSRKSQMANAYSCTLTKINPNQPILLVDDVLTTGATLESAAFALARSDVRNIKALVFTRA